VRQSSSLGSSCFQQLRYVIETPASPGDTSTGSRSTGDGGADAPASVALVLEVLSGGDLFDRIESFGPLEEKEACRICEQLLHALEQLHCRGIVLGNLSPSTVSFVSAAPEAPVRVADLSQARQMRSSLFASAFEPLDGLCGTPDYAAPEVLTWLGVDASVPGDSGEGRGKAVRYGTAVDMWSLGVLLYIMLSGFPPFFGEDESQLLSRVAAGEYSFPSTVGGTGSHSAVEQATNPFPTSWARVSPLAKDLIKSLLLVQPSQRLTVSQALAHRWISGKYDARHAVQLSLGQLRTRQDNSWDGLKSTRRGPTPPRGSARSEQSNPPFPVVLAASARAAEPATDKRDLRRGRSSMPPKSSSSQPPVEQPKPAKAVNPTQAGRGRMGWSRSKGGARGPFSRWFANRGDHGSAEVSDPAMRTRVRRAIKS